MKVNNIISLLILLFLTIVLLITIGCGEIISIEGVELRKVVKETREPLENEQDIEFTPEGALPIGSILVFGKYQIESESEEPLLWRVIENKSHYKGDVEPNLDHITLLTEYIIDLRGFDSEEPEYEEWEYRQKYGNNRYKYSTIRQWLNTDKKADNWWEPAHEYDGPPTDEGFQYNKTTGYIDKDGFLNSFDENETSLILDTALECGINNNADGGGSEYITDKVFLLSLTEVGLSGEEGKNYFEGFPYMLFDSRESRMAYLSLNCFENTNSVQRPKLLEDSWDWFLRSPYSWGEYDVWLINDTGMPYHRRAHQDSVGIRVSINIAYEDVKFEGSGTLDDPYIIVR